MFHGDKSCLPERVMLVRTSSAVGKPTNNCVGVLVACASKIFNASHFYEKYDADLLWNLTPLPEHLIHYFLNAKAFLSKLLCMNNIFLLKMQGYYILPTHTLRA